MVPLFNFSAPFSMHFIIKKSKKFPKCNCHDIMFLNVHFMTEFPLWDFRNGNSVMLI